MKRSPDYYQKKARAEGYNSRAAYKLMQMDDKHTFLAKSHGIVELGAYPGGWTAVVLARCPKARLVTCDLQELKLQGKYMHICGDFCHEPVRKEILKYMGTTQIDLVLSDMSPNISGNRLRDQANMLELTEECLRYAQGVLKIGEGTLLIKLFQGEEMDRFVKHMKDVFEHVKIIKPSASSGRSSEIYLLGSRICAKMTSL